MKNKMLKSLILFCVYCFIQPLSLVSAPKCDSLACLQLEGRISNADAGINGECTIELICLNTVTDTIFLKDGKKKFRFILNKDRRYVIRISKKGYMSKLVCINTEMFTTADDLHRFEFETSLLNNEEAAALNRDVIDFPVAMVCFNYEHGYFSYDKAYSKNIKNELYEKPVALKGKQSSNNEVAVSR